jgi:hypothetical protein
MDQSRHEARIGKNRMDQAACRTSSGLEPRQSVNLYFTSVHSAGKPSFQEIFLPSE